MIRPRPATTLLARFRATVPAYHHPLRRHQATTLALAAGLPWLLYQEAEFGYLAPHLTALLTRRVAANVPALRRWLRRVGPEWRT